MFNPKGAKNLVGFINGLKVIAIVLSLLWGIGGGLYGAVTIAQRTGSDGAGTVVFGLMLFVGIFWALIFWALLGAVQHHLAAVSDTAQSARVMVAQNNILLEQSNHAPMSHDVIYGS